MKKIDLKTSLAALTLALAACGNAAAAPQQQTRLADMPSASEAEAAAEEATNAALVDGFEEIIWEDMMPEGEEERLLEMYADLQSSMYGYGAIAEGSIDDKPIQIGTFNVVKELDGKQIRLPGYTVPLEYSEEITEFLLVPYFGACLHAPPPPPNQTLYVKSDKPIKLGDLAQAVWVYGTLRTQTQNSDLADTAYTLELSRIEEYTY